MSIILCIEFHNIPPIYLTVKRILWISQYSKEISKFLDNPEPFALFLDSKPFPAHLNLGTVYDLYAKSTILYLKGIFSPSNLEFDRDFFLQSLKESEYLRSGSISKIQSLSLTRVDQLLENLEMNLIGESERDSERDLERDFSLEILNFPIKLYLHDQITLRKYSKSYADQGLVQVLHETWANYDFIYFGVLLDDEFTFTDTLSLLTPDNWFHLVLRSKA